MAQLQRTGNPGGRPGRPPARLAGLAAARGSLVGLAPRGGLDATGSGDAIQAGRIEAAWCRGADRGTGSRHRTTAWPAGAPLTAAATVSRVAVGGPSRRVVPGWFPRRSG